MKILRTLACISALIIGSQSVIAAPISLSDDDFSEQSIGFDFSFFGESYNTVFIGSNGYLTFGGGDTDFSESITEFVNELPRIAVWDDFNPSVAGSIEVNRTSNIFTVSYLDVPQFGFSAGTSQNTFSISIFSNGNIEISLDDLDTNDLLVGVSAGAGAPAQAVDFSERTSLQTDSTVYEFFGANFDLNQRVLRITTVNDVSVPGLLALFSIGFFGLIARRFAK